MALLKTRKIKGLDAQYWRLVSWDVDLVDQVVTAKFALYLNRAQRLDSIGNWFEFIDIKLPMDAYNQKKIYDWVKAETHTTIQIIDEVEVPLTTYGFFYQSGDSQE